MGGVLYYLSRPVEGIAPDSREAWLVRSRPVFRVIVPVSIAIHFALAVTWWMN